MTKMCQNKLKQKRDGVINPQKITISINFKHGKF